MKLENLYDVTDLKHELDTVMTGIRRNALFLDDELSEVKISVQVKNGGAFMELGTVPSEVPLLTKLLNESSTNLQERKEEIVTKLKALGVEV